MVLARVENFILLSCSRSIQTTAVVSGKKNVRKFPLFAFRWTRDFKRRQAVYPDPDIPVYKYGMKEPGLNINGKFTVIPEMIPEIIVPDLKDCKLKPYVSYRAADVIQSEFTAQDLFDAVYSRKIEDDFRSNKLDEKGEPLEPSEAEAMTANEAKRRAKRTGCDLFTDKNFSKPAAD